MKQSQRSIQKALKDLRRLIDASKDPVEMRIAYAMECAIRWATEDTTGWDTPAKDAVMLARMLRTDLESE